MRRLRVRSYIMAAVSGAIVVLADAPAAAQVSTLDAHRARAAALFDRRLDAASATRVELTDGWKKYERGCRGKVTTGLGVGVVLLRSELVWFAQSLGIDNETTPDGRLLARGEDGIAARRPRAGSDRRRRAPPRNLSRRPTGSETGLRPRVKKRPPRAGGLSIRCSFRYCPDACFFFSATAFSCSCFASSSRAVWRLASFVSIAASMRSRRPR